MRDKRTRNGLSMVVTIILSLTNALYVYRYRFAFFKFFRFFSFFVLSVLCFFSGRWFDFVWDQRRHQIKVNHQGSNAKRTFYQMLLFRCFFVLIVAYISSLSIQFNENIIFSLAFYIILISFLYFLSNLLCWRLRIHLTMHRLSIYCATNKINNKYLMAIKIIKKIFQTQKRRKTKIFENKLKCIIYVIS